MAVAVSGPMAGTYEHSYVNEIRGSCQKGNCYGKLSDYQFFNCCIFDGYYCCVVDRHRFFLCRIAVCKSQGYFTMLSPRLSLTLFTLLFLSPQTRHGRNIVSFYFCLFICGRAKCLSREQCVRSSARVDALCSSCSLQNTSNGDQQL
jgi:hypothetical protein